MYTLKLEHLKRHQAEERFRLHCRAVLAGDDLAAKRKAWATFVNELVEQDDAPTSARYWQYPTGHDSLTQSK